MLEAPASLARVRVHGGVGLRILKVSFDFFDELRILSARALNWSTVLSRVVLNLLNLVLNLVVRRRLARDAHPGIPYSSTN